jgi:hypothetical protein
MLFFVLLVVAVVCGWFSWRHSAPKRPATTFYYWVVGAIVVSFLIKRMTVLPMHAHVYLCHQRYTGPHGRRVR